MQTVFPRVGASAGSALHASDRKTHNVKALPVARDQVFFGSSINTNKYVYRSNPKLPRVDVAQLKRTFVDWTGRLPETIAFGPNRVNLIGEHTDYNDGFVMPIAMDIGTYAAAVPRADRKVRVRTLNKQTGSKSEIIFQLDNPKKLPKGSWGNYVKGTLLMVQKNFGLELPGMDILLQSDGPSSSGLSSSAALETAIATAALNIAGKKDLTERDKVNLALAGQAAEHHYAGVKCGIMDQAASTLCKPGHALKLDCRMTAEGSYRMEHVPINFPGYTWLVMDSLLARKLEKSEFNERRNQCESAVTLFSENKLIKALRDILAQDFLTGDNSSLPEVYRRRARHVITENDRVLWAVEAMKAGDAETFGRLMNASHDSLRDDYEVSGEHLDTLVETARSAGAVGARLTGAGFGGCAVALVKEDKVAEVQEKIRAAYKEKFGVEPAFYLTEAAGGAREVQG